MDLTELKDDDTIRNEFQKRRGMAEEREKQQETTVMVDWSLPGQNKSAIATHKVYKKCFEKILNHFLIWMAVSATRNGRNQVIV